MIRLTTRTLLPRFLLVGGLGFLLDASAFQILVSLDNGLGVSRIISAALSITLTWYLNRRFAFQTRSINAVAPEYARYVAVQTVGLLVNFGIYFTLIGKFDALHDMPLLALCCGAIAALVFNFLGARHYVFQADRSAA
jgi:putative flippase GtrA